MKPYRFGTLMLPQYNASWDLGGAEARDSFMPMTDGYFRQYGSDRAPSGLSVIPYTATMHADTPAALQAVLSTYRARKGMLDKLWCQLADGSLRWTWAELTRVRERHTFGPKTIQDLEFGFTQTGLAWYAETQNVIVFTDLYDATGADLLLMGVMGMTPGSAVPTTWINNGNEPTSDVVFTLTSGTGTITGLTINNTTTGYTLTWTGSLTTGQVLSIDTGALSVTKQGAGVYSELTPPTNHSEWMEIVPGVNNVSITITDTAVDDSTSLTAAYYAASA